MISFRKLLVISGLTLSMLAQGCGYSSQATLPNDIKTIYVDTVINAIEIADVYAYVPGLEMDITQAIIKRIHRDGNLRLVDRDEADVILETKLVGFQQEGLRFTSLERVEEFRLFIVLSMQLIDTATDQPLWIEHNFSGDAEYFVSDIRNISREEGARRAIDRLARNVVDRIVEDW